MDNPQELTVYEMCRKHLTADEDFARSCNPDGTVKESHATTIFLKSDPSRSITIDNTLLFASFVAVASVVMIVSAILLIRHSRTVK